MLTEKLAVTEVWRAIDIYIATAYSGPLPSAVRAKLETLRLQSADTFYSSPLFERANPRDPVKISLRLGNRFFPHMKLTIEESPDKHGYLFRADTHDRHCCPVPSSREYGAFCELMESNQKIAQAIETAWAEQRLPTFKTFLRDDLARRVSKRAL